jgi:hypothetical protein
MLAARSRTAHVVKMCLTPAAASNADKTMAFRANDTTDP